MNLKEALQLQAKPRKYRNEKIKTQEGTFDSLKEFQRWNELKLLQMAGEIQNLYRQQAFLLIPTQFDKEGKVIEKACVYVADFTYIQNGEFIVEDVKSPATRTPAYIIKRKLMLKGYGIRIREV